MNAQTPYPLAQPHDPLHEVLPNIYRVRGSVSVRAPFIKYGPLTLSFSRNMYVVKDHDDLTLINSVRLNEAGMARLSALGKIKNVIRLAGFHGMDDPFYRSQYGATVYSVDAPYTKGMSKAPKPGDIYFQPDVVLTPDSPLPIKNALYTEIRSATPKDGLLILHRDKNIMISGDSFQHWPKPDPLFNVTAKILMRLAGFFKETSIGPGWRNYAKPDIQELIHIANTEFDCLLPGHGEPVLKDASQRFLQRLQKMR
ncbi:hypothetical protein [Alteromonas sp. a30]|uniref:hypothetical protein n=1 Tax=Alteromonas sp. a30 TaxID=2730917 RepID=UPI00227DF7DD|nr:hypothetical protein [Alteromonas sp. a30]MCY7295528.1 hypothetical protein [Alteromonas sp. a30]